MPTKKPEYTITVNASIKQFIDDLAERNLCSGASAVRQIMKHAKARLNGNTPEAIERILACHVKRLPKRGDALEHRIPIAKTKENDLAIDSIQGVPITINKLRLMIMLGIACYG